MKKKTFIVLATLVLFTSSIMSVQAEQEAGDSKIDASLTKTLDIPLNTEDNELYVDLSREIEKSERDRRVQGNSRQAEEGVSLLQAQIREREAELEALQKNLKSLDGLQTKINEDLKNRIENNPNIKLLVTLYESLSPDQSANLLKRLPMTISLKMIQMMNPKKFSKILAAMDPSYASELSRRLIREPALASIASPAGGK